MELPDKKTLDDIEKFGIQFSQDYTAVKSLISQSFALAKKYIVTEEVFDENGVRVSYTSHPNLALYTEAERNKMLMYYDFLKSTLNTIQDLEHSDNILIYDLFNTRSKLDQLIAMVLGSILVG